MTSPTPPQWDIRQPDMLDFLRPNGFYFLIQNLPQVTYFCQSANIPSVNLGFAIHPTPFANIPKPGEKIDYGELSVKFLIQETMANYIELYNWILALGFPESRTQFSSRFGTGARNTDLNEYSDATLLALDSNYNPVVEFAFKDCFPVGLTGIEFDVSTGDTQYFAAQAIFKYRTFTVTPLA